MFLFHLFFNKINKVVGDGEGVCNHHLQSICFLSKNIEKRVDERSPSGILLAVTYFLTGIIAGIVIGLVVSWQRMKFKLEKMEDLEEKFKEERSEKDRLAGSNKELYANNVNLQADRDTLLKSKQELQDKVTNYKANEKRAKKDQEKAIGQLDAAKESLDKERERVTEDDKKRQQKILDDRDRMWNEHEHNVQSLLKDLCKKPDTFFTCYDNTNIPEDFTYGRRKPDLLIEFLGQFVIFDAKSPRSAENLKNYIPNTVKTTAANLKGNTLVYPTIFFVVPTDAISELSTLTYNESEFTFHVVSPEALAPTSGPRPP